MTRDESVRRTTAETERVEAVLRGILAREGVAFTTLGPLGGHMDKRERTYTLAAPLPVTDADLAALAGPLTHVETAAGSGGGRVLVRLTALDPDTGGVEVVTP